MFINQQGNNMASNMVSRSGVMLGWQQTTWSINELAKNPAPIHAIWQRIFQTHCLIGISLVSKLA
jgi:hypothetical protein